MRLVNYFHTYRPEKVSFARSIGVDVSTLYLYLADERTPRLDIALNIQHVTKGLVSVEDLVSSKHKMNLLMNNKRNML